MGRKPTKGKAKRKPSTMTTNDAIKAMLEELLQEAMRFGGILPIRVLRNKLKEAQAEE